MSDYTVTRWSDIPWPQDSTDDGDGLIPVAQRNAWRYAYGNYAAKTVAPVWDATAWRDLGESVVNRIVEFGGSPSARVTSIDIKQKTITWSDPLDVEYDGVALRHLLLEDAARRCEVGDVSEAVLGKRLGKFTPAQRAAVSAHWSARLRAKVAASEAADAARRPSVLVEIDVDD